MREESSSPSSSANGSAASERTNCSFYFKIGACRHGPKCSRLHTEPKKSQTILLRNFYRSVEPFLTPQLLDTEDGSRQFESFFYEVFTEIERKYGRIADLKVCENIAEHLIGNVYIRFESSGTARRAVDDLNRRWFARQPIYAELSPVTDFRDACCRQHEIGECNRAGFCNFLHIKQPSVRVMARIREERAVRTDREHSPSSSLMSSSSSECSFASDSESSASSEPSVASMHSNLGDDSDVLPKIYRLEASSSSDEESDSDASLWGRRAPASLEASEDSDPNSRTPRAFRPTADESSDDAEMSDSEREMLRRRKQKLRRQRWEQLRVELSPKWDEDRERNFVFSLL